MAVDLARWSVWRVLLVAFAWLVGVPAAFMLYIQWKLYLSMERGPGIGDVVVSVGFNDLEFLVWLLAPVLFVVTWAVLRSRRSHRPVS
jgi:hypothetical protein